MVNAKSMQMQVLQPLEFADCLLDSPEFRENLNRHEKELDRTSQQIKRIIKEVKDLLSAAKSLSRAQKQLSISLNEFNFECIGTAQTDDEQVIVDSLKQFSRLIQLIEDERSNMLERAHDQIVIPLEQFRKEHIGGVKENKKKFEKKTAKFCSAQERLLNMSSKKPDNSIQEVEAHLGMLKGDYLRESLSYVLRIQGVQERIKFEFVEPLLSFMQGWLVFYHSGHEIAEDAKDYISDLMYKVQKTRNNFEETHAKAEELKAKYMDSKMKPESDYTKQGYLFLMEKKAFTATWSKYYCKYKRQTKQFTMMPYNQISARTESTPETLTLFTCTRKASDFEKRFCFDVTFEQRAGVTYTFQALNEDDRKTWMNAMDGKEPTYLTPGKSKGNEEYILDDVGFTFVRKCIEVLESRGLEEEGLYRIGGVGTKIAKFLNFGTDSKKTESERFLFFNDDQYADLLESKTIASALKHYLRHLTEPLMTYRYHNGFIAAAKQETRIQRISDVHTLVYRIPHTNFEMLEIVVRHLKAVAMKSQKNKMSIFNLGVVFGPTLLRSAEETMAAILDIKFNNVVIEILVENYDLIFKTQPGKGSGFITSHASPPDANSQKTNSHGYRTRGASLYQQPVVRVVTSLQSIPNGVSHYANTSNGGSSNTINSKLKNVHPIYDSKSHMMQSTPSLIRDLTAAIPRDMTISRGEPIYSLGSGQISHSNSVSPKQQPHHIMHNSMNSKLVGGHQTNSREKLMLRDGNGGLNESVYGQTQTGRNIPTAAYNESLIHNRTDVATIVDRINSTSSSNESVCSSSSRDIALTYGHTKHPVPANSWDYPSVGGGVAYQLREESSPSNYMPKKSQRSKDSSRQRFHSPRDNVRVRTLYACLAENDGELSFEPNQIITNVRQSNEPGWLEGSLNGKSGLIPENYVEILP